MSQHSTFCNCPPCLRKKRNKSLLPWREESESDQIEAELEGAHRILNDVAAGEYGTDFPEIRTAILEYLESAPDR